MSTERLLALILLPSSAAATAQTSPTTPPPPAQPSRTAEAKERLHKDFAWLGRYRKANARLAGPVAGIFMSDTITPNWPN